MSLVDGTFVETPGPSGHRPTQRLADYSGQAARMCGGSGALGGGDGLPLSSPHRWSFRGSWTIGHYLVATLINITISSISSHPMFYPTPWDSTTATQPGSSSCWWPNSWYSMAWCPGEVWQHARACCVAPWAWEPRWRGDPILQTTSRSTGTTVDAPRWVWDPQDGW